MSTGPASMNGPLRYLFGLLVMCGLGS
jgi:hypothetical protein